MRFAKISVVFVMLAVSTTARNNTSSKSNCPGQPPFNATASLPLRFLYPGRPSDADPGDWTFTSGLYFDDSSIGRLFYRASYISVPEEEPTGYEGRILRACVFQGPPLNISGSNSPSNGSVSCQGVLSEECITALENKATKPVSNLTESCSLSALHSDEVQKACGWTPNVAILRNLTDPSACTVLSSQFNTPEGYVTYPALSEGIDDVSDASYDLHVRQIVPWIIGAAWSQDRGSVYSGDQGGAVVCIAPSNIAEGSREPTLEPFPAGDQGHEDDKGNEGDKDHDGAAAVLGVRTAGIGAMLATGAVIVALL